VRTEEGRLCIFQFLVDYSQSRPDYPWLKRGMSVTESRLQSFGLSVKGNSPYFGSSYSLLEGSYLEWDLDSIYKLGDWTSQPYDLKTVHEINSWFLYRSRKGEEQGFAPAFSLLDLILGMSPQRLQVIIAAAGVIASIVIHFLH